MSQAAAIKRASKQARAAMYDLDSRGVALHIENNVGPEASHESWMAQKVADGWKYGPVKDPERKEHPCMMPFAYLPAAQQTKDFIFRGVVHALAAHA